MFEYDKVGNLTKRTDRRGKVIEYAYHNDSRITRLDNTDQLTGATYTYLPNESYGFDAAGNRTNSGYTTGTDNRLSSDGVYNYIYDNEGNRTRRTKISDNTVTDTTYDHRNRLTSVTERATVGGAATKVVNYVYDLYNRLVSKSLDPDGDGAQPVQNWYYAYDGSEMVLRFNGSAASNLKDRYLWAPAVDQILADEQVSSLGAPGTLYWPLTDNLGSVRMLAHYVSQTDTTTYHNYRIYNAFGQMTETYGYADELFGYTGRLYDKDTALQYNLNRWYDSKVGRWLSQDPIGFAGGDANLYAYCGNDPANQTDPSGLAPPDPSAPFEPRNVPWNGAFGRNVLMPDGSVRYVVGDRAPLGQTVPGPVDPLDPKVADYYRRTARAFSGPHVPSTAKAVGRKIDWDCFWKCMDSYSSAVLTSWIPNPLGHGVPASLPGAPAAVLTTPFGKPLGTVIPPGGSEYTRLTRYVLPTSVNNFLKRPFARVIGVGASRAIGKVAAKAIPIVGWATVAWDAGAAAYCASKCTRKADSCGT